ncbi:MAG: M20/M25/M40 family metallo-hydrolase [Planctomycetia bacterium]|nr:M20/M25/M40 family metallo-hydrolase [Planctomycetia bacterium]
MSITRSRPKRARRVPPPPHVVAPEPDLRAAQKLVLSLLGIPGTSGGERQVRDFITDQLRRAGAPPAAIRSDHAHRRTPIAGEVGNLIMRLPGTAPGARRLLVAHMDTVPLCVGAKPVVKGQFVRSASRQTGLGADDRAGCAVILTAALEILRRKLPHPPLVFLWPVQEEIGLYGARNANLALLGGPKLAFNWDGGPAEKLTIGATGAYRIQIMIEGLASHAGGAPERGVSAITIAGLAIAELARDGWLGDVRKGDARGTSNIGVIQGGAATNVVTDRVDIKAEARSHDPEFRRQILGAIEQAFHHAAGEVRNVEGVRGRIVFESRHDYEAFCLPDNDASVLAADKAVHAVGGQPFRAVSNGGLDANWLTARGIPTVTLGCGQLNAHTTAEQLDLAAFRQACRVALRLATGTE